MSSASPIRFLRLHPTGMLDLQPTLQGSLLRLRPLVREDLPALYAVARDPLIWEQHPDKTRSEPDGFARFFAQAMESRGALAATDAATGEMIGSSRYYGYNSIAREVEIGWTFLARRYWGGAYNREMKQLMLDHAFQAVDRVLFLVAPLNHRSQRAVLKLGAVRDGSQVDGSGNISLRYSLPASTWCARQPL